MTFTKLLAILNEETGSTPVWTKILNERFLEQILKRGN